MITRKMRSGFYDGSVPDSNHGGNRGDEGLGNDGNGADYSVDAETWVSFRTHMIVTIV